MTIRRAGESPETRTPDQPPLHPLSCPVRSILSSKPSSPPRGTALTPPLRPLDAICQGSARTPCVCRHHVGEVLGGAGRCAGVGTSARAGGLATSVPTGHWRGLAGRSRMPGGVPEVGAGGKDAFFDELAGDWRRLRPVARRAWARAMAVRLSRVSLRGCGRSVRTLGDGEASANLPLQDAVEGRARPPGFPPRADALAVEPLGDLADTKPCAGTGRRCDGRRFAPRGAGSAVCGRWRRVLVHCQP